MDSKLVHMANADVLLLTYEVEAAAARNAELVRQIESLQALPHNRHHDANEHTTDRPSRVTPSRKGDTQVRRVTFSPVGTKSNVTTCTQTSPPPRRRRDARTGINESFCSSPSEPPSRSSSSSSGSNNNSSSNDNNISRDGRHTSHACATTQPQPHSLVRSTSTEKDAIIAALIHLDDMLFELAELRSRLCGDVADDTNRNSSLWSSRAALTDGLRECRRADACDPVHHRRSSDASSCRRPHRHRHAHNGTFCNRCSGSHECPVKCTNLVCSLTEACLAEVRQLRTRLDRREKETCGHDSSLSGQMAVTEWSGCSTGAVHDTHVNVTQCERHTDAMEEVQGACERAQAEVARLEQSNRELRAELAQLKGENGKKEYALRTLQSLWTVPPTYPTLFPHKVSSM